MRRPGLVENIKNGKSSSIGCLKLCSESAFFVCDSTADFELLDDVGESIKKKLQHDMLSNLIINDTQIIESKNGPFIDVETDKTKFER